MTVQTIVTPAGERLIVLPEAEFQALVEAAEDAADSAAAAEILRKIATGEEELIPSAIVDRLLSGENRIRVWREHRGLTSGALAERSGMDLSDLSKVEAGQHDVPIDVLRRLADALSVAIDDLVG